MLGKKRACPTITCQAKRIIEAKVPDMASVPPPVEDFVTEDEASHTSPLCTPSPIVFPEAPVARIAKMTRLGTKRLAEKYKKIKIAFEEYLFKVQTFLDPMANVTHAVISRKDYALASLERA